MSDDKLKQRLKQLLALPQNRVCCDCSMAGPTWASKNLGVFICLDCAGVHRSLGTHISEVRSVDLDTWIPAWVAVMEGCGNVLGNRCWEARLPPGKKITPASSKDSRNNFIRDKYARKAYWSPLSEEIATAAPVLSAAEQRKQLRLARLNSNNSGANASSASVSPLPSPVTQQQSQQQYGQANNTALTNNAPMMMDLFSGMTVKTQPSASAGPAALNLFDGMSIGSFSTAPAALSPAPSGSSISSSNNNNNNSFDLLNLDAIPQENNYSSGISSGSNGFVFRSSSSPVPVPVQVRHEDPFAEFITL